MYTGEPYDVMIPFFDHILTVDSVATPGGIDHSPGVGLCPGGVDAAWCPVPDGPPLRKRSRSLQRASPTSASVPVRTKEDRRDLHNRAGVNRRCTFPAGSIVVPAAQRASHVAAHLLEPRSGDSFVAWGFFNAIFEQKEYAEDYVMEKEGKAMLDADPALRTEFIAKVACGYGVRA